MINRFIINQPSTLQTYHKFHAAKVLADLASFDDYTGYGYCWFADGKQSQ